MKNQISYSPEVRERAIRLVLEQQKEHESQWSAIKSIASKIGCTAETLRTWVRRAETDQGIRCGMSTSDRERLKELERENRELKRANEILRKASGDSTGHCNTAEIFCDGDKKFNVFLGRSFNSSAIMSSCSCE